MSESRATTGAVLLFVGMGVLLWAYGVGLWSSWCFGAVTGMGVRGLIIRATTTPKEGE